MSPLPSFLLKSSRLENSTFRETLGERQERRGRLHAVGYLGTSLAAAAPEVALWAKFIPHRSRRG